MKPIVKLRAVVLFWVSAFAHAVCGFYVVAPLLRGAVGDSFASDVMVCIASLGVTLPSWIFSIAVLYDHISPTRPYPYPVATPRAHPSNLPSD